MTAVVTSLGAGRGNSTCAEGLDQRNIKSKPLYNLMEPKDPVPPGGRKTLAAGNPAFLLSPFGRSTHLMTFTFARSSDFIGAGT